jgi:hypothetical protein
VKQTRLVVEQQHNGIRGVEQGPGFTREVEERLFLIGHDNLLQLPREIHMPPDRPFSASEAAQTGVW